MLGILQLESHTDLYIFFPFGEKSKEECEEHIRIELIKNPGSKFHIIEYDIISTAFIQKTVVFE